MPSFVYFRKALPKATPVLTRVPVAFPFFTVHFVLDAFMSS